MIGPLLSKVPLARSYTFFYMSPGYDAECCSTLDCFGSGI